MSSRKAKYLPLYEVVLVPAANSLAAAGQASKRAAVYTTHLVICSSPRSVRQTARADGWSKCHSDAGRSSAAAGRWRGVCAVPFLPNPYTFSPFPNVSLSPRITSHPHCLPAAATSPPCCPPHCPPGTVLAPLLARFEAGGLTDVSTSCCPTADPNEPASPRDRTAVRIRVVTITAFGPTSGRPSRSCLT